MQIFKDITSWQEERRQLLPALSVGFVPTMGNLHAGHASLFQRSKQENDITIASIFVNPTQFNRQDDFDNYPQTLVEDQRLLEELGVDYCLMPQAADIYHDNYRYKVD